MFINEFLEFVFEICELHAEMVISLEIAPPSTPCEGEIMTSCEWECEMNLCVSTIMWLCCFILLCGDSAEWFKLVTIYSSNEASLWQHQQMELRSIRQPEIRNPCKLNIDLYVVRLSLRRRPPLFHSSFPGAALEHQMMKSCHLPHGPLFSGGDPESRLMWHIESDSAMEILHPQWSNSECIQIVDKHNMNITK